MRSALRAAIAGLAVFLATAQAGAQTPPPTAVDVAPVVREAISQTIEAPGSLYAGQSIELAAEIAGRVVEIGFADGAYVEEGTVLFRLDDALAQATLAEAEADLDANRRNLNRARELASRKIGTERSVDEALAALQLTQARVELARVSLAKTVVKAPFSGETGFRMVDKGAYVSPGEPLVTLVDNDPLKLRFALPERYAGAIRKGQSISFTTQAWPGEEFTAAVTAISPQIDENGRSLTVQARAENPDGRLRAGMFARVRLTLEQRDDALVVPEEALVPQGSDRVVYRVVDGKADRVVVRTGTRLAGKVEIIEGLEEGDVVITAGQMKIGPGSPVAPRTPPAAEAASGGDA